MNSNQTGRYLVTAYGTGENLAPLVHSEQQLGNKLFFRRLSVRSGENVVSTPAISGNSFRGAWRDQLAMYLVEELSIHSLSDLAFVTLFSGGSLDAGDAHLAQSLYQLFPGLRLFGFSMGKRMYPSRFSVDFAVPLTRDTQAYAEAAYPQQAAELPKSDLELGQITAMTMMTRKKDDEKAAVVDLTIEPSEEKTSPTQMIFHVEYVVANMTFVHGFRTVYPVSELEFGALLKLLEISSQHSYGGMTSRGFGRMNWHYKLAWRTSLADANPQEGEVHLEQEAYFDDALITFKERYEQYVANLPQRIKDDEVLAPVIQVSTDQTGT